MKFLYSHRTRSVDGQYVHIRALTEALRAREHTLSICGPNEKDNEPKRLDAGVASGAKSVWPKALYEAAEFGYSVLGFQKLNQMAKTSRPDVLYERYNLFYHAGVRLARSRRLPFILEVNAPLAAEREKHGGLGLKGFARWSEQSIWRAADAVLPVTGVLASHLEAVGVSPDKITIIQNGVDETFLTVPNVSQVRSKYDLHGKIILGFTGFVRDWHGVDRVLNYMAKADRSDLHLLLVGDGPARADLQTQAQSLGIADRLTVSGVVQREEMPAYVAAFDIALQPAVVDYASPLKLFEYMGLARPILAPDSANIKEVLTSGEDSILFDRQDRDAFERSLARLVSDADLRQRLGAAAQQSLLHQKLTWAHNAERVEKIAEGLMRKPT